MHSQSKALEIRCGSYESMSESELSIVPVPVKLARVNGPPAAVICSSSSDVS
jgi:hypothetical protein